MPEAEALLVRSATTVDAEVLAAPKLKIVARAGVGLDNVDVDAAGGGAGGQRADVEHPQRRRARGGAAAGRRPSDRPADASLRERTWKRSSFSGTEIYGKTAGVVGLGRIGQLVSAARLAAFGTHVVAYDPRVAGPRRAARHRTAVALDELLARSDFISVHLPKTPETAGLIGKEALAKTKPGVIIVNAARGGLIDEEALAEAVASGHVRAAGIDVFAKEPATDSPLFDLPQVVVTPHLGASTAEAQDRAGTDVAESVKLALAGEFVPDAVNVGGGVVGEEVAPWLDLVRKLGLLVGGCRVSCRSRCRSRSAASWHRKMLRCCAFRHCAAVLGGHRGPGDVRQRAGAGCRTRRGRRHQHRHRKPQPPQPAMSGRSTPTARSPTSPARSGPQLVEKIVQINGRNFDLRAEGVNLIINYIDRPGRWARSAPCSAPPKSTSMPPTE